MTDALLTPAARRFVAAMARAIAQAAANQFAVGKPPHLARD